ncbi:Septum site-determining protein MinC [Candidatus Syntrophocurvum alkaliphilum]|uniref:Probable septum site-determining protein MinC n=1 Tax=Candidatus Syntrophocurvum alkaliphilum TaxID=2293317 RepID=A0A6I6DK76_9FIRM|nr:septum site-determining protein MinC [Candidatus Syntrophocurvum alkaliphilum]QGU00045.1 Septum site-determining protein MinC [Candidatus Syntrophocurvum alkaliphilum]
MSIQQAFKNKEGEVIVDLKSVATFYELKDNLANRLEAFGEGHIGTQVIINIGNRRLTHRQLREIEDILLNYGFHLKDIINSNEETKKEERVNIEENIFDEIPYYENTILINRHLRSGQKFFNEGNIVILGDINPGAEVIAGGNILVMGSLRGMAHAGCFGDETAVITAYRLSPTQLRIANHITRPPDGEKIIVDNPERARIKSGKVVIEKLKI